MDRKYLIELMAAAIAGMAGACGCASAATPQHTSDLRQDAVGKELGAARNTWTECVRAAIPRVDDPHSPSEVVARAAMKSCAGEYTDMVRVLTSTLAPGCGKDAACTRDVLAKAQRDAIKAATDEVVTSRVREAGAASLRCQ
jgi:hypothetical protein